MNLTHLKFFHDAATTRSITQAAKRNFVSRPAVSQGIRRLEDALNVRLLEHKKNLFQLTREGELLYARCEKIFSEIALTEQTLKESEKNPSGQLTLALSQTIALSFLPEVLKAFQKRYPRITFKMALGKGPIVLERILNGSAEFGIVVDHGDLSAFHSTVIGRGQFILVGTGKLEKTSKIIFTETRPETARFQKRFREKFGQDPNTHMIVDSWGVMLEFAARGFGMAWIPDFVFTPSSKSKLKIIPTGFPPESYELCLIHKKGAILSKNCRLFYEIAQGLNRQ